MRTRPFLIVTFALAACTLQPPTLCSPPAGWEETLTTPTTRYNDIHPDAFAEIACAVSESGTPVRVALDWPAAANPALQTAWDAPTNIFLATLTRHWPHWKTLDDGRTDSAVMAMVERLHEMKATGLPIAITAYEGDVLAPSPDRQTLIPANRFTPTYSVPTAEVTYSYRDSNFTQVITE